MFQIHHTLWFPSVRPCRCHYALLPNSSHFINHPVSGDSMWSLRLFFFKSDTVAQFWLLLSQLCSSIGVHLALCLPALDPQDFYVFFCAI